MTTTDRTAEELRASASAHEQEAADSFDRCDTDGFVSQWAHGISAQRDRLDADIAEAGGVVSFPALYSIETGERVPAKLIDGQYGLCWALVEPGTETFSGVFVKAFPKREATMARKGYREGHELVPAKATIRANGTGLSGAASAYVAARRLDDGTGQDERIVPVAVEDEVAEEPIVR